MPAAFEINKAKNKKFYFNLLAANGEVILTSQMYKTKVTAKKGIASVQVNAVDSEKFTTMQNKNGEDYFVLKAANSRVIGTSQAYSGKAAMNKGIKSVSKGAPTAKISDLS